MKIKRPKPRPRKRLPNGARAKCCPICNRPFVQDLDLYLPPIQKRIFELVERHGEIYPDVLWTALYGSDPNGGPDPKVVEVHINMLNKRLQPHGLAVRRRVFHAPEQPWRIVQLAPSTSAQEAAE